ncbi:hypothetical protein ADUPG1_013197 [Aduncisulcus paluster]|uniref:Uncharacterized protein n=1 Tax=Aduncisulcus paluster TaxID=2918883 RepID=A0ABQ5K240_9EUKA|nr:hypothetical protein ADUPG1_013197 [Aduncisulcus paluster]|eukprot:gnl/Carplike_NY0171/2919_a3925_547.p1 GENE.gnl/Carplike_NY0171/2919_a3925_547~~gnl/Carplike_NY0171/2919_a3925_547.p1  ORF type:complete len:472 (-),score=156.02 gnl/Carplike_NY0171/2919_a3925_547:79-1494(-)
MTEKGEDYDMDFDEDFDDFEGSGPDKVAKEDEEESFLDDAFGGEVDDDVSKGEIEKSEDKSSEEPPKPTPEIETTPNESDSTKPVDETRSRHEDKPSVETKNTEDETHSPIDADDATEDILTENTELRRQLGMLNKKLDELISSKARMKRKPTSSKPKSSYIPKTRATLQSRSGARKYEKSSDPAILSKKIAYYEKENEKISKQIEKYMKREEYTANLKKKTIKIDERIKQLKKDVHRLELLEKNQGKRLVKEDGGKEEIWKQVGVASEDSRTARHHLKVMQQKMKRKEDEFKTLQRNTAFLSNLLTFVREKISSGEGVLPAALMHDKDSKTSDKSQYLSAETSKSVTAALRSGSIADLESCSTLLDDAISTEYKGVKGCQGSISDAEQQVSSKDTLHKMQIKLLLSEETRLKQELKEMKRLAQFVTVREQLQTLKVPQKHIRQAFSSGRSGSKKASKKKMPSISVGTPAE